MVTDTHQGGPHNSQSSRFVKCCVQAALSALCTRVSLLLTTPHEEQPPALPAGEAHEAQREEICPSARDAATAHLEPLPRLAGGTADCSGEGWVALNSTRLFFYFYKNSVSCPHLPLCACLRNGSMTLEENSNDSDKVTTRRCSG